MKTTFYITLILTLLPFLSFSQTPFEGTIMYTMSFEGLPEQAKSLMTNSTMKMFVKNGNTRTELNMVMVENTNIYDAKTKTTSVLMNMMGKKYVIKQKAEDVKENKETPLSTIVYSDETKVIAGYICKKAILKSNEELSTLVWYTDAIPNSIMVNDKTMLGLQKLKGMPMEFEMKQAEQGFSMRMVATNVVKEPVADSKFVVPADYKETTKEELLESFQKNRQEN